MQGLDSLMPRGWLVLAGNILLQCHSPQYPCQLQLIPVIRGLLLLIIAGCWPESGGLQLQPSEDWKQPKVHQRILAEICAFNQTDIRLYLPFSRLILVQQTESLFQINQKMVITIWLRFDLMQFRKVFSMSADYLQEKLTLKKKHGISHRNPSEFTRFDAACFIIFFFPNAFLVQKCLPCVEMYWDCSRISLNVFSFIIFRYIISYNYIIYVRDIIFVNQKSSFVESLDLVNPKPNLDCIYNFLIDLALIGFPFGAKSIGKCWL